MQISLGKWRRLQQASSNQGTFTVLAADHRGPLRTALAVKTGTKPSNEDLIDLKVDMVSELASATTAVLLDPETGAGPCITSQALPGSTGLLMAMDNGTSEDPALAQNGVIKNWSVGESARLGAAGIKLLVFFHPDCPRRKATEQLVVEVAHACEQVELPFYLEPLSFWPNHPGQRLPTPELRKVVIESARSLAPLGADVLKVEFPVNVADQPDESEWAEACQELTAVCPAPWVLLSAGVSYETFLKQTHTACGAGASGIIVGRAVWNEAVTTDALQRRKFLREKGLPRMQTLLEACESGRPFWDKLQVREDNIPGG